MHDLGGRHGFGTVVVEPGEPSYHARWEAATRLLFRVILARELLNGSDGALRHAIERMDPMLYLSSSYGSVALRDRVTWLNDRPAGSQMASANSLNAAGSRWCAGASVAMS